MLSELCQLQAKPPQLDAIPLGPVTEQVSHKSAASDLQKAIKLFVFMC